MIESPIPTPYLVGVRAWLPDGVEDAHGNPAEAWDVPAATPVHGVGPRLAEEPGDARRWLVVEGLTVYAPPGTRVHEYDLVEWEGETYQVDGPPADWTKGPWRVPTAGVTFDLVRRTG